MNESQTTVVAVLTPAGRGAVASVAVAGPLAARVVAECFAPAAPRAAEALQRHALPPNRIVFGRWTQSPAEGEEVVVARRGERHIEIHCHGGQAVSRALLASLVERGCRHGDPYPLLHAADVPPGDRREEKLFSDDFKPSERVLLEARQALAEATTERTAAILLDQWRGALAKEVAAVRRRMAGGEMAEACGRLWTLLEAGELGMRLTRPFRVVLAGRPNVGKSSLVNAILGYTRAIVFQQPGTTRDVLTAHTAVEGWPIEISDTAGLRSGDDPLETVGIERARERIAAADLVVAVMDCSASPDEQHCEDEHELRRIDGGALVVWNKCDLIDSGSDARAPGRLVSALTGAGLAPLLGEIARRLVPLPPPPGSPVPFTARQMELLRRAHAAAREGDAARALALLQQL